MQYDLNCFLNCVYLSTFSPGDFIFLQEESCAFRPQLHRWIRCNLFSQDSIMSLLKSRFLHLTYCIPGTVKYNGLAQENTQVMEIL